ncbi:Uncharacterized protein dnm_059530 [Desulfonema magnum]|uniref:Uncharacterized protein n=1 Tax=Desulfonema magnum TaxID=45655 RepID=A0A975GQH4_9BACT|nr:Uncharacterized protein dnm_059530 [Desulfonema magnum]
MSYKNTPVFRSSKTERSDFLHKHISPATNILLKAIFPGMKLSALQTWQPSEII